MKLFIPIGIIPTHRTNASKGLWDDGFDRHKKHSVKREKENLKNLQFDFHFVFLDTIQSKVWDG
jgi:hypothetical protein